MTRRFLKSRLVAASLALGLATSASAAGGRRSIKSEDLKKWLTYIASDELQGRALYSTGLGLAAAYIEARLREWGVKPAGDSGSYFQTVRILGIKSTSHSTLTVDVGTESRTFVDGQGITFPKNIGGKRSLLIDRLEFVGYGLNAPVINHADFADKSVKGAAVLWLGTKGPNGVDSTYQRVLNGRGRHATEQLGAAASIGPEPDVEGASASAVASAAPPDRRGAALPRADFTTSRRLDTPIAPSITASDAFLEFIFSAAPTKYAELRRLAIEREPLPSFRIEGVTLTFNLDADYQVVRTQLTQNVVAVVEGSDSRLKDTYVAFGAHYDHVGYAQGEVVDGRRVRAPGRVTADAIDDRIWNGADDDGSGTVALIAIARAFGEGPRPKRSILLVWHSGEESGLLGSRYFADYPAVPLDRIVAQLNLDMIGRNRNNQPDLANTVYLVGSDRISTELHELNRAANAALSKPLTLDYELNDPADREQLYSRSDHYSYAAKGIPVIFFTTALHPDYHANTDEVSKIEFEKMTRIAQMAYETGWRVANLDHAPVRDNQGPRTGKAAAPR